MTIETKALAAELRRKIEGEVRFDNGSRALYATDASNYRQVPIGVVIPRTVEDVEITVATACKFGAPVLSRGGGTSLAGQCCNVAVVMDFSKYLHQVLEIDTRNRLARVRPGCVLDSLRNATKKLGLTFGPDPATHDHCTLGGMLGNNSCGIHSLLSVNNGMGMRTSDNTHELEVLTYDGARMRVGETTPAQLEHMIREGGRSGEIYAPLKKMADHYGDQIRRRFPKLPRRVSGFNLDELLPENHFHIARALVGSESTCVTILEATLHLVPEPKARSLLVLGYADVYESGDHVMEIREFHPIGLEGMDRRLFKYVKKKGDAAADLKLLPEGGGWLLVEFGGDSKEDADQQARDCMEKLKRNRRPPAMKLYDDPEEEEKLWKVREGGLGSTAWVPGLRDFWPGWEDSAVPPEHMGNYLRELRDLMNKFDYQAALYGHLGQGCIHCRIPFDLYTADGIRKYRSFVDEATDLVVQYGGTPSGEHGDGQSRAELLSKVFGPELVEAFREFKRIWDPQWKMNPGKVVDANPIVENLRLGPEYSPPQWATHFHYPSDHFTFQRAALRCVGVGKCRREDSGTMCPSYMVTREEKNSTRGRARLLWEMLNGGVLTDGWKSEAVKDALDLCLSCKGCKGDCPVNVDMATYKAEFLAHYYQGRLRPRSAYAFGLIHRWARVGSAMPRLTNFVGRAPVLREIAKWTVGMAPQRSIPRFAPQTFKDWFRQRSHRHGGNGAGRVILWPDTFNDFFHPQVAQAAVATLEEAGFRVEIPAADLCCGRPLYDYGFLDLAKRWLQNILEALQAEIRADVPVVVLEPSCCAVFRDELINLFPNDRDANRLKNNTFLLSEFLQKRAPHYRWPQVRRKALVHGHCHHKSILDFDDEKKALKKLGLDFEVLDSGCCGMAGAFGFEKEHYDVAMACGERVLLPAVRRAPPDTLLVADGFSCREQILQATGREALHLAQVIQMGSKGGNDESEIIERSRRANLRPDLRFGRRSHERADAIRERL